MANRAHKQVDTQGDRPEDGTLALPQGPFIPTGGEIFAHVRLHIKRGKNLEMAQINFL